MSPGPGGLGGVLFPSNRCSYLQRPHFVFNLRILDGNIFTAYVTPSRFIHCITPNITTRFSKEDSFIRNINHCPMMLGSSAEHCRVKANAGWRGLSHILLTCSSFHPLLSAASLQAAGLCSGGAPGTPSAYTRLPCSPRCGSLRNAGSWTLPKTQ